MKNPCVKIMLLIISLNFIISGKVKSQDNNIHPDSIIENITNNFRKQIRLHPQEKIYAQIDKPYYITGEDIWFRIYLTDAYTGLADTTSRYVYAELINPLDSVINRVKIRPVNGAYHGYINLQEDMGEGEYMLRFYTRFMESLGDSYFFKRSVRVGDPLSALYRTETKFEFEDKGKVNIKLQFTDIKENSTIRPDNVQIIDNKGLSRPVKIKDDNTVDISMKFPDKENRNRQLYIRYDYDGKFHKEYITIPNQPDFEVSFMPEGGYNIVGTNNRIAFKALKSDGTGEDIEGSIVNVRGDTLGYFNSVHMGMGMFLFQPAVDSIFYVVCKNKEGIIKKYQLPDAVTDRASLQINRQANRYAISVRTPHDSPANESLFVAIQCRGLVINAFKWDSSKPFMFLPREDLPSGIIQFLLVDSDMNPISERLVFNINEEDMIKTDFITDKNNYEKRELVKASVKLSDYKNNPTIASLSVSITDDKDIKPDTCVNILSTLLLASELKGYIESPAYYFYNNRTDRQNKLDLLMMTQGWSRYDVEKILKGDFQKPKGYLEMGQYISGIAKGGIFMNRKSGGYPITLISPEAKMFSQTLTDENSKFYFMGFEAPDSTSFIIQGLTKKGGSRVELLIDKESFPESKFSLPFTSTANSSFEKYIEKAEHNFVLTNGMRMIYLKDIEIIGKKNILSERGKSSFSSGMNPRVSYKEFEQYHPSDIFQVLRNFSGVVVSGDKVSIRGGGDPLILVDDIEYDPEFLSMIPVQDVDEIEVIKDGTAAIFGMRGGNGVIMITTKRGEISSVRDLQFNIKKITPLGYQVTKKFYSPQYDTRDKKSDANPDLRTTIYWDPSVKTDADGTADINFYTSDGSTSYSVIIEGITTDGSLIYSVQKISRND